MWHNMHKLATIRTYNNGSLNIHEVCNFMWWHMKYMSYGDLLETSTDSYAIQF